jgi:transcriptional regulator with XRE-family HTH domain
MDLRIARLSKKFSQWQISRFTGINQTKVSLIENGFVSPSREEKERIAKALALTVDEIKWTEFQN